MEAMQQSVASNIAKDSIVTDSLMLLMTRPPDKNRANKQCDKR